ncbi:MAG: hypothetical protein ACP5MD_12165, partial [Verrucomicrobiia bacterium]
EIARRLDRLENVWRQLSAASSKMGNLSLDKTGAQERNHIARAAEVRASLMQMKREFEDVSQELLDAFDHRRQLAMGERTRLTVPFPNLVDSTETRKAEPSRCALRMEIQSPASGNALLESPKPDMNTCPRVVQETASAQPCPSIPCQQQVLPAQASADISPFRGAPVFIAMPIMLPSDPRPGMRGTVRMLRRSAPLGWPYFRWNPTRPGLQPTIRHVPLPVVSCPVFPPMPRVPMYIFIPDERSYNVQTACGRRM